MKQLLILSGKGGTGKTTIATSFIKLGNLKAFADCDVDAPNIHLLMNEFESEETLDYYGMDKAEIDLSKCIECGKCIEICRFNAIENIDSYNINKYNCEGCGVCEAICPEQAISMKKYIAGKTSLFKDSSIFSTAKLKMGSGNSGLLVSTVKKNLIKEAVKREDIEIAIIDGSPGIGCPVIASLSGTDAVLLVVEPSISGISDMKRIIETSKRFKLPIMVCINKYDTNLVKTQEIEDYCLDNNLEIVGKIPFDKEVIKILNKGKSVIEEDNSAAENIKQMYKNVMSNLIK